MQVSHLVSLGASLATLALAAPGIAADAAGEDPAALRAALRELRAEYESRIRQLEARIDALEAETADEGEEAAASSAPASVETPTDEADSVAEAFDRARAISETFQPATESHVIAARFAESQIRERMEEVLANYIDITGYVRAGYGRNDAGGPQTAFKAPGAGSKYRLGNEAETYAEITFAKSFFARDAFALDPRAERSSPSGPVAHWQARVAFNNPYSDFLDAGSTGVSLPEAWASIGNVVAAQPELKFWAGNRFYRRHDIHVSDFYFYNMSGGGGGFEDLELSFGKLAFAWIGWGSRSLVASSPDPDPENQAGFSKHNWDLRFYDVPLPFGTGEFGLTVTTTQSGLDPDGNKAEDAAGFALSFIHTRAGFISEDGVNKFSLQYGRGPGITFTSGFERITVDGVTFIRADEDDFWRVRLTESFVANLSDRFSLGPVLVYELTDYGRFDGKVAWLSAGVRPIIHFNNYLSLAFEGGVDWVDDELREIDGSLYKFTIAPQVSLGGRFMSRPVLRGFVTYSRWSDAFVGEVGGPDYVEDDDGLTLGVQMEAWW
ncbi:MAG: carbohydrate porin [Verrucomicrobia bacterium]|nr:MAG: carbohydrate porin [Verrucomicrobiota bacterium]